MLLDCCTELMTSVSVSKRNELVNEVRPTTEQEAEALLRAVPKRVHGAALFASLVGVFYLLRFCASASSGRLGFGKAILYGLLVLGLLCMAVGKGLIGSVNGK